MSRAAADYTLAWFLFEKGVALVYLIAFLCVVNQFIPLLGEDGLLPVPAFAKRVSFRQLPSLFLLVPTDRAFSLGGWAGVILSALLLSPVLDHYFWGSLVAWAILWVLYLSFVNVGQTFYGFGWESILLETGFFTIFAGSAQAPPDIVLIWIWRWILFRIMWGAGLIKLRADPCWKNLTCLDYHFETQPIPNPLSWFFHWLPPRVHKSGVLFNHLVELIVPFLYFAPQPAAAIAGLLTIAFQGTLMLSGNLSWLNLITIVLAFATLDNRLFSQTAAVAPQPGTVHQVVLWMLAAVVVWLSFGPVRNMFSRRQLMNYTYNPFHLVNTYGAFGGVTRTRYEIVVEGAAAEAINDSTEWKEYEFKGKPGAPTRRPPQIAPYHLRLDWLIWFAAMQPHDLPPWFIQFVVRLLENDRTILGLLKKNPFPDGPPRYIRASLYEYHFTAPAARRATGRWWDRALVAEYLPPVSLRGGRAAYAVPGRMAHRL